MSTPLGVIKLFSMVSDVTEATLKAGRLLDRGNWGAVITIVVVLVLGEIEGSFPQMPVVNVFGLIGIAVLGILVFARVAPLLRRQCGTAAQKEMG